MLYIIIYLAFILPLFLLYPYKHYVDRAYIEYMRSVLTGITSWQQYYDKYKVLFESPQYKKYCNDKIDINTEYKRISELTTKDLIAHLEQLNTSLSTFRDIVIYENSEFYLNKIVYLNIVYRKLLTAKNPQIYLLRKELLNRVKKYPFITKKLKKLTLN